MHRDDDRPVAGDEARGQARGHQGPDRALEGQGQQGRDRRGARGRRAEGHRGAEHDAHPRGPAQAPAHRHRPLEGHVQRG